MKRGEEILTGGSRLRRLPNSEKELSGDGFGPDSCGQLAPRHLQRMVVVSIFIGFVVLHVPSHGQIPHGTVKGRCRGVEGSPGLGKSV